MERAECEMETRDPVDEAAAVVRLWLLRILVRLGGHREFVGHRGLDDERVANAIGLAESGHEDPDGDFAPELAILAIRELHEDAEKSLAGASVPLRLARNAERLGAIVGLSEVERRILEFAVMAKIDPVLLEGTGYLEAGGSTSLYRALSVILTLPEGAVRAAVSAQGALLRSGLVTIDYESCRSGARAKLELLSLRFADRMMSDDDDPILLLREAVSPASPPLLAVTDFAHVSGDLAVLEPYLAHALHTSRAGVNVLIHGDPGTGKSQLARVLAARAGAELFEVASEDGDGDPLHGELRLRSFRAAQCCLTRRRAMVLFDEVEDVFSDGGGRFPRRSVAQHRKAWINRALEGNPVPAIWLSNSVSCFDPAFLRRFDVVLELGVPPLRDRERIVSAACGDMLTTTDLARFAATEPLAPAVVARAASVLQAIRGTVPAGQLSGALCRLVEGTLAAQGHGPLARADYAAIASGYDPEFVNADTDVEAIATGLGTSRTGRLCLYGPPGTGKSAFGRWLADRLDMPLHARRVSDIVSPYVGVTERNLLRAFREAEAANGVLLLDEIDSFLQDRRGAQRSWEVTQVNEMLTQMESFGGVFVATTNLLDGLDQAALRRFDLKVRFGYLRPEQSMRMLARLCSVLGLLAPSSDDSDAVARLAALTPGDFATAARQHRFRPFSSPADLLRALVGECELKASGPKRAIGF